MAVGAMNYSDAQFTRWNTSHSRRAFVNKEARRARFGHARLAVLLDWQCRVPLFLQPLHHAFEQLHALRVGGALRVVRQLRLEFLERGGTLGAARGLCRL